MARVMLLNWTPEPMRTMTAAALLCYEQGGPLDAWRKAAVKGVQDKIVAQCAAADHGTVLEHVSLMFGIVGISRACSHQLVRHRLCSFDQQSQRYVGLGEDCWEGGNLVEPPSFAEFEASHRWSDDSPAARLAAVGTAAQEHYRSIVQALELKGARGEAAKQDARYILPNAFKTNLMWTINLRSLIHVCGVRLCARAQWEIRDLMAGIVTAVAAEDQTKPLTEYLVPKCERLGYCNEGSRSCDRMPTREAVLEAARKQGLYGGDESRNAL